MICVYRLRTRSHTTRCVYTHVQVGYVPFLFTFWLFGSFGCVTFLAHAFLRSFARLHGSFSFVCAPRILPFPHYRFTLRSPRTFAFSRAFYVPAVFTTRSRTFALVAARAAHVRSRSRSRSPAPRLPRTRTTTTFDTLHVCTPHTHPHVHTHVLRSPRLRIYGCTHVHTFTCTHHARSRSRLPRSRSRSTFTFTFIVLHFRLHVYVHVYTHTHARFAHGSRSHTFAHSFAFAHCPTFFCTHTHAFPRFTFYSSGFRRSTVVYTPTTHTHTVVCTFTLLHHVHCTFYVCSLRLVLCLLPFRSGSVPYGFYTFSILVAFAVLHTTPHHILVYVFILVHVWLVTVATFCSFCTTHVLPFRLRSRTTRSTRCPRSVGSFPGWFVWFTFPHTRSLFRFCVHVHLFTFHTHTPHVLRSFLRFSRTHTFTRLHVRLRSVLPTPPVPHTLLLHCTFTRCLLRLVYHTFCLPVLRIFGSRFTYLHHVYIYVHVLRFARSRLVPFYVLRSRLVYTHTRYVCVVCPAPVHIFTFPVTRFHVRFHVLAVGSGSTFGWLVHFGLRLVPFAFYPRCVTHGSRLVHVYVHVLPLPHHTFYVPGSFSVHTTFTRSRFPLPRLHFGSVFTRSHFTHFHLPTFGSFTVVYTHHVPPFALRFTLHVLRSVQFYRFTRSRFTFHTFGCSVHARSISFSYVWLFPPFPTPLRFTFFISHHVHTTHFTFGCITFIFPIYILVTRLVAFAFGFGWFPRLRCTFPHAFPPHTFLLFTHTHTRFVDFAVPFSVHVYVPVHFCTFLHVCVFTFTFHVLFYVPVLPFRFTTRSYTPRSVPVPTFPTRSSHIYVYVLIYTVPFYTTHILRLVPLVAVQFWLVHFHTHTRSFSPFGLHGSGLHGCVYVCLFAVYVWFTHTYLRSRFGSHHHTFSHVCVYVHHTFTFGWFTFCYALRLHFARSVPFCIFTVPVHTFPFTRAFGYTLRSTRLHFLVPFTHVYVHLAHGSFCVYTRLPVLPFARLVHPFYVLHVPFLIFTFTPTPHVPPFTFTFCYSSHTTQFLFLLPLLLQFPILRSFTFILQFYTHVCGSVLHAVCSLCTRLRLILLHTRSFTFVWFTRSFTHVGSFVVTTFLFGSTRVLRLRSFALPHTFYTFSSRIFHVWLVYTFGLHFGSGLLRSRLRSPRSYVWLRFLFLFPTTRLRSRYVYTFPVFPTHTFLLFVVVVLFYFICCLIIC